MDKSPDISQSVVRTVHLPLLVLDESLRVCIANRSFYETFNTSAEVTEGRCLPELGSGQWNIPELLRRLEEIPRLQTEFADFELDRDFPEIGRRILMLNARGFRHADSLPGRILLAIEDITSRRRNEANLLESERRLEALMDNTPAVAFMRDEKATYVYINHAFELVTGKPASEILGRTPFEVWPEDVARQLVEHDNQVFARNEPLEVTEITSTPAGDQREWLTLKFPFSDSEGRRFVGSVSIDVTERRRLEDQLRKAQKMEAIGRLAGGLAHDFNNLLTVINGYSQLMLENLEESTARQDPGAAAARSATEGPLREILRSGERAAELTRQLLAFSRQQPISPVILDMNGVVQGVERMLRRLIGENIDLRAVLGRNLFQVRADPAQMEQVLVNLAVNARDAMPNGGSLTIETANVALDELYSLAHPLVTPGDYLLVAVSDTGVGMDRATQAHIFEPFFTTKEQGKGTGLGLATVYGIVKQSGGFIWLYSEPGRGATFKIYLPRAEGDSAPRTAALDQSELRHGTETILLVEDDGGVRELASQVLKSGGYHLLVAADPEEAVRIFEPYPETIHLLLTDVVMPKASGRDLAGRLLFSRPEMKVLFMSGYTEGSIVHQGVIDEGAHLLQKPFSPDRLLRTVHTLLDS